MAYQMKRDPSRLRQEILRLEESRAPHVQALLETREPMRRGSFVTLHRKCGKPTCHCAVGEGHPAKYLSLKDGGRTRLVYVGSAEEISVAETNGRYRRFRGHRATIAKLSKEVLALILRLEAALVLPDPRPVKAKRRSDRGEGSRGG
jgi:hypothetical protein